MNILQKILNPKPETRVELVMLRPCFVAGVSYETGDIAVFSERVARELVAQGSASNREADARALERQKELEALLPPPVEKREMPESWQSLPESFAAWWELNESRRALTERRDFIESSLLKKSMRYVADPNLRALENAITDPIQRQQALAAVGVAMHVGEIPQQHIADCRFLRDALERATRACDDWNTEHGEQITVAAFKCSEFAQAEHGTLCRDIRELHAIGREIFASRISALGLSGAKVAELFNGSADAVRFAAIQEPSLQDLKLAFYDDSGPTYYIARGVDVMASLTFAWRETAAEVTRLTKLAKGELKKAAAVAA